MDRSIYFRWTARLNYLNFNSVAQFSWLNFPITAWTLWAVHQIQVFTALSTLTNPGPSAFCQTWSSLWGKLSFSTSHSKSISVRQLILFLLNLSEKCGIATAPKVDLVKWSHDDRYIITAHESFEINIWCSISGTRHRTLKVTSWRSIGSRKSWFE